MVFLISCGICLLEMWENVFLTVFQEYLLWGEELSVCAWFSILLLYPYHHLVFMLQ